jgi:hypothetical protein
VVKADEEVEDEDEDADDAGGAGDDEVHEVWRMRRC